MSKNTDGVVNQPMTYCEAVRGSEKGADLADAVVDLLRPVGARVRDAYRASVEGLSNAHLRGNQAVDQHREDMEAVDTTERISYCDQINGAHIVGTVIEQASAYASGALRFGEQPLEQEVVETAPEPEGLKYTIDLL